MRISMTVKDGALVPPPGLRLAPTLRTVDVEIPDEAVARADSPSRRQIDQILGGCAVSRPARAPEEDKADWHKHLEETYLR